MSIVFVVVVVVAVRIATVRFASFLRNFYSHSAIAMYSKCIVLRIPEWKYIKQKKRQKSSSNHAQSTASICRLPFAQIYSSKVLLRRWLWLQLQLFLNLFIRSLDCRGCEKILRRLIAFWTNTQFEPILNLKRLNFEEWLILLKVFRSEDFIQNSMKWIIGHILLRILRVCAYVLTTKQNWAKPNSASRVCALCMYSEIKAVLWYGNFVNWRFSKCENGINQCILFCSIRFRFCESNILFIIFLVVFRVLLCVYDNFHYCKFYV